MGRLFDSSSVIEGPEQQQEASDVRKRAAEFDAVLQEVGELDAAGETIRTQLEGARAQAVQPIVYKEFRAPGSKWMIEHARDGSDYIFQLFPLKPPKISKPEVIQLLIVVIDLVFPRSVWIDYVPPDDMYATVMYTIKVRKIAGRPGWKNACQVKALELLGGVDAWPLSS